MGTDRQLELLATQLIDILTHIQASSSATAERLATGVMNNVLEVRSRVFGTDGFIPLSWGTTCGSIEVTNHGTQPMYVASGPPSGVATPSMPRIDPGTWRMINVGSRNVTLYGTNGDTVGYQAFTRGMTGAGIIAVDGGAP